MQISGYAYGGNRRTSLSNMPAGGKSSATREDTQSAKHIKIGRSMFNWE